MKEFKGTRDLKEGQMKWHNKDGCIYHVDPKEMYEYGGGIAGAKPIAWANYNKAYFTGDKEIEANALLISKAPELLEMLHKITVARRNGQEIPLMEIENLIKSASQVEG